MPFLYILQSLINHRYYIGSTNNPPRRLAEHNAGKSKYTRLTRPFKLMFTQEYSTINETRKMEYKLKKFKSKVIIEKIIIEKQIKLSV